MRFAAMFGAVGALIACASPHSAAVDTDGSSSDGMRTNEASSDGSGTSSSAGSESSREGSGGETTPIANLHGVAEKGPFVVGSTITISPLDADGQQTGQTWLASVLDDSGAFADAEVPAGPALLEGNGFHFNESTGSLSGAPVSIRAVLDLRSGEQQLSLNVVTHLIHIRVLDLLRAGTNVSIATGQAQRELVVALGIGGTDFVVATPASELTLRGPDSDDNAYLLAVGAVLIEVARQQASGNLDAALQEALNGLALALAQGNGTLPSSFRDAVRAAEGEVEGDRVMANLSQRFASLGIAFEIPDIHRVLDYDHDGLRNIDDNCREVANPDQLDRDADGEGDACDACPDDHIDPDGDGIGPTCDACPESGVDSDDDGAQDACDNCPLVANDQPTPNPTGSDGNSDDDEWGDACDSCPLSSGVGGNPDDNCCDPRLEGTCTKTWSGSTTTWNCGPVPTGERFACVSSSGCLGDYGQPCAGCPQGNPCVPAGGLCDVDSCYSRWCTVGDDEPCATVSGAKCMPWFAVQEAPDGLSDLGVCARVDAGPCVGLAGRECATW